MAHLFVTMNAFQDTAIFSYPVLFAAIREAGYDGVEIRRELLEDPASLLPAVKGMLDEAGLIPYYSCPVSLFGEDHQVIDVTPYGQEAVELGAKLIKFSLGNYRKGLSDMDALAEAAARFSGAGILLAIENDQTTLGGKAERLAPFFAACRSKAIPIRFTCDIGNWAYTGEDAEEAAAALKNEVVYIHVKEVVETASGYATIPIGQNGRQKWKQLLRLLPKDAAIALEFPIISDLKDYIELLKEEVFANESV